MKTARALTNLLRISISPTRYTGQQAALGFSAGILRSPCTQEADKFAKAFKDPEFIKLFEEYAKEVSDPKASCRSMSVS